MNNRTTILYLGALTPDKPEYRNAATSTAANLFQANFLTTLREVGHLDATVRAYFPIPSFPRSKKLFCWPKTENIAGGIPARSLAHINLGPLKILTLGISAAWAALCWGVRNRKSTNKVVLCYNLNAPPAFFLRPVCRLLKMKLVPFIGDIYIPGEVIADNWMRRLEFKTQTGLIPKVDGLLVCNRAIVEDFAPEREALLIEGGVRESLVRDFEARPRHSGDTFNLVFAGQLSDLNGVQLLLKAVKLLDMPSLRVTILGGGEYADEVRDAAKEDPRICYRGLVAHYDVLAAYADADLLVNLRRTVYDTHRYVFPSKVVECLATGRPLLSTLTGHVVEEFGEFVFLLDQETPEGLAQRLQEIADMPMAERIALGTRAQQYVLHNKTWETHLRNLGAYLADLEAKVAA